MSCTPSLKLEGILWKEDIVFSFRSLVSFPLISSLFSPLTSLDFVSLLVWYTTSLVSLLNQLQNFFFNSFRIFFCFFLYFFFPNTSPFLKKHLLFYIQNQSLRNYDGFAQKYVAQGRFLPILSPKNVQLREDSCPSFLNLPRKWVLVLFFIFQALFIQEKAALKLN